jgi:hypothetical protein
LNLLYALIFAMEKGTFNLKIVSVGSNEKNQGSSVDLCIYFYTAAGRYFVTVVCHHLVFLVTEFALRKAKKT